MSSSPNTVTRSVAVRWFALAAAAVALAGVAGHRLPDSAGGNADYAEYGAAARALLARENPYDAETLLRYELPAGWVGDRPGAGKPTPDAQMMWNPPWVAPLILPLGVLGWGPGYAAWAAANFAAVLAAVGLLWRVYHGRGYLTCVLVLAAVFPPTLFLVRLGQISGFSLLGLAGFVAGLRANRPVLAGVALALTGVKPHLLLSFAAVAAAVAVVDRGTRRAVVAGCLVLAAAAVVPVAFRPGVWPEYVAATDAPTDEFHVAPAGWDPPVLSAKLSKAFDNSMAVQFAPSAAATIAVLAVWWVRRRDCDWPRELPVLTLVCLLTTGYGAWGFDLVLLLVPLTRAAARVAADGRARVVLWCLLAYFGFAAGVSLGLVPVVLWTPLVAVFTLTVWAVCRPGHAALAR